MNERRHCLWVTEDKKINEHGAVCGSVCFSQNTLHITRAKKNLHLLRGLNVKQFNEPLILQFASKYQMSFNAALKKMTVCCGQPWVMSVY